LHNKTKIQTKRNGEIISAKVTNPLHVN